MILQVALPVPLLKVFDYTYKAEIETSLVGRRVKVPFGFRPAIGIVVGTSETSSAPLEKLKAIYSFVDNEPLLTSNDMALGRWISLHTVCSLGEALFSLIPSGVKPDSESPEAVHHDAYPSAVPLPFELNDDQKAAVLTIHQAMFGDGPKSFLIHGVSAAGKTAVYHSAVKDALDQGKTALYLIPEIGLAAQAEESLVGRFGRANVIAYHSDLRPKQRIENWWRIRRGEASIVVGTRSAALAPIGNVGVIIVDEEHDGAYKEERKPRFHARDVAFERARLENAIVILGSATPCMESMEAAQSGRLHLIELSERAVAASAPRYFLTDIKSEKMYGTAISPSLEKAINERHQRNEQTILFLNRRGFHRYVRCPHCAWTARCPTCGIAMVHHKRTVEGEPLAPKPAVPFKKGKQKKELTGSLTCHTCGKSAPIPIECPDCHQRKLFSGGFGTERVEEELKEKFPWARVVRWDSDVVSKKGEQERIYKQIKEGDADIVIGTQMVAHGFNFPKVTLVGVVDADGALHLPDFRAAERTFQLITQVAGRAGRFLVGGDVIVQTRSPDHYALDYATRGDTAGFLQTELNFRRDLNYPPYSHLIDIRTDSKDKTRAHNDVEALLNWVWELKFESPIGVLGPTPLHGNKKGKPAGFQVLLKVPRELFEEFLIQFSAYLAKAGKFRVDVDPL